MQSIFSQQLVKIIEAQCFDTDTPRSLMVWLLIKNEEYGQLFSLKTDPSLYLTARSYFLDNQITEFIRKIELDIPGFSRSKAASDSFYESERQCYRTNQRLMRYQHGGPFEKASDLRIFDFFESVKRITATILGPIPLDLNPRHGPGGTYSDRGALTTVPDKMSSRPTVCSSALSFVPLWARTKWALGLMEDIPTCSEPSVVPGNRFTTVPKDVTKDRGICIEPSMMVYYQLGVGSHIRQRLKGSGIDLERGQDVHRKLAASASVTGAYATIDLSNASDTVSLQLCKLLLPRKWFDLLFSLRSPKTLIKGHWVHLEKFSSMGNGYTFELETLIFLAISYAIAEELGSEARPGNGIWVYGDDIIVPTEMAEVVIDALKYSGFTPNPRKTFITGSFRESCGGDFFDGTPVRAHYLKEDPHEPQHFITLANGIRRMVFDHSEDVALWRLYKRSWHRCLDALPSSIRCLRGPTELGDLVIHDDQWSVKVTNSRGYAKGYVPFTTPLTWDHWKPGVVLAAALYGCRTEGVIPRGKIDGYRIKWVAVLSRPPVVLASN